MAIRIHDLRVNYLKNPIGLDSTPKFTWKLSSEKRGEHQTAYRLMVSSSKTLFSKGEYDLWDTGKRCCADHLHIPYEGAKLPAMTRCFWGVTVYGGDDMPFTSEAAFFETGKLDTRWEANWITAEFVGKGANPKEREDNTLMAPYLRKAFTLKSGISDARLYICGLGYFEASVNGQKTGDDLLSTAFTQFDKTDLYLTYDVTDKVKAGKNAIGIVLGNGWYNCFAEDPWNTRQTSWRSVPKVMAELRVTYTDGTRELIATRPDWKSSKGPIFFNGIRNGEHYDARLELGNWTEADYDDSAWENAKILRAPGGKLLAFEMEPIRIRHRHPAVRKWKTEAGWVFDIGQNQAGIGRFILRGPKDSVITLQYSDALNPDQTFTQASIGGFIRSHGFQTDQYIKKSDAPEEWQPRFVYHGFQYILMSGIDYEPELSDVTGLTLYNDFDHNGEFSCSDELLNKVQQLCWWSTVSNCHSIPTDCPHREKNGWTGDASASSEQMLINFGTQAFFTKWAKDLRDAQRPSGSLPCVVPSTGWGYNSLNGPDWSSAMTNIPWNVYTYNADTDILAQNYENIKRHCDFMESMTVDYTLDYGLGDWCAPFEGPAISVNMASFKCPTAVTDTAFFYSAAMTIVKIADILGCRADAAYYEILAAKIKKAFRDSFFDKKTMTVKGDCQTATACMLYQGLAEEDEKPGLMKRLLEQIAANGNHLDFGILGTKYVMHTLGAYGEGNVGFEMLAQRTFPGCQQWIDLGATTLWECWNGGGSHNHHMFSDLSAFLYKYVGGISPDESEPGFKHILLRPAIDCGLTFAKSKVETIQGEVYSHWTSESGKQSIELKIPVGSYATLYLPLSYKGRLMEEKKPASDACGVHEVSGGGEYALNLTSGSYRFYTE